MDYAASDKLQRIQLLSPLLRRPRVLQHAARQRNSGATHRVSRRKPLDSQTAKFTALVSGVFCLVEEVLGQTSFATLLRKNQPDRRMDARNSLLRKTVIMYSN